jgi:hypothetical protein
LRKWDVEVLGRKSPRFTIEEGGRILWEQLFYGVAETQFPPSRLEEFRKVANKFADNCQKTVQEYVETHPDSEEEPPTPEGNLELSLQRTC